MKLPKKVVLPERFQMRLKSDLGFTHSCEVIGDRIKVKWARGWHEYRQENPKRDVDAEFLWTTCDVYQAEAWIDGGHWIVVEEPEQKEQEQSISDCSSQLPDEFYFQHSKFPNDSGKVTKVKDGWKVLWKGDAEEDQVFYPDNWVSIFVRMGSWKIIDKKPLSAEQQRANKEAREQKEALFQSIKHAEQVIEHKNILISNYKQRIAELNEKIVEE